MSFQNTSSNSISIITTRLHVRQFTTTTVFADPTSLGSHVEPQAPVPVAAIAGGACGGVVLAVLVVIGWKWWGREIKKKESRELEKRKAMVGSGPRSARTSTSASRASSRSPSGTRSHRTSLDSVPSRSHSRSRSRTGSGSGSPVPPVPPLPPLDTISSPRPLKPRSHPALITVHRDTGTISVNAAPYGRTRAESRTHRPLRPSPLAQGPGGSPSSSILSKPSPYHSPRTADLAPRHLDATTRTDKSADSPKTPVSASAMIPQQVPSQSPSPSPPPPPPLPLPLPPPSSFARLPRIKASLQSLSAEARRQSKASSHNSASDQSRHSSAGGSGRRWSWWSLINGRGPRPVGPTTGMNRISADTSVLYSDWQEEVPSAPIGYAYSGVDNDDNDDDQQTRGRTLTNHNTYVSLDSDTRA